ILVSVPALMTGLGRLLGPTLRTDARRVGTTRSTSTTRAALVMLEFALALPLLVGAGLLLQSLRGLQRVNPGFDANGAVSLSVTLPSARYPDYGAQQEFWRQLDQQVALLPSISAAGYIPNLPPDQAQSTNNFNLV